jgi:AraC-like DNA-binding protein
VAPRSARVAEHRLAESVLRTISRPLDPRCARFTEGCYGYEERSRGPLARSEFATASLVMIFEIGAPLRVSNGARDVRHAGGFVAGLHDGPTRTEHDGHQAGVQLNLSALAARELLGIPLAELAHDVVSLADALPRAHRQLPRRLGELATWEARLDAVESLLLRPPEPPRAGFTELAWAVAQIERSRGAVRMRALARELGWSERRLQRAFAHEIGLAPKRFARLVRFEALTARVRAGDHVRWAEDAQALGYYDEAHLSREVREFTGLAPSAAAALIAPSYAAA